MKVPPKRKGNSAHSSSDDLNALDPSMKVPPKRKGNAHPARDLAERNVPLNESPSEKEGKYTQDATAPKATTPSMKVPPKRKGNEVIGWEMTDRAPPQ